MGQQIPAELMGSMAEGGGAGEQAALGSRTQRGTALPDTPTDHPQTSAALTSFSVLIYETEKEAL